MSEQPSPKDMVSLQPKPPYPPGFVEAAKKLAKKEEKNIELPARPAGSEVRLERFQEISVRGGREQLPTDIVFEDGSSINIEYRKVQRRSEELSKCAYCDGLPTPNPNCPICKGSGSCVPMSVGSPMRVMDFIKFVADDANKDEAVMTEFEDMHLIQQIELLKAVKAIKQHRPWMMAKLVDAAQNKANMLSVSGEGFQLLLEQFAQ